jgi:hypothetical protein
MPLNKVKQQDSSFAFGALIAALIMFLIAGALYVHVFRTKKWLSQIKSDAALRAQGPRPKVSASAADLSTLSCPDSKPVLIGFDEKGHAKCRAVSNQSCAPGQYISTIDPASLEIHCSEAGADMQCPLDSYITEFMWLGESRVSFSCNPRLNPFMAWKFEPTLGSQGGSD